jgi:hypothetical protein
MAHQTSFAPKRSEWVAVRVAAVIVAVLQSGQAARLFAEGQTGSALLIMLFVTLGAVMGMLSLMRPTYVSNGQHHGETPGAAAGPEDNGPVLARWDWKVNAALACFFVSVAIAGVARVGTLLSVAAIVGLVGLTLTIVLAVRDLRHRRRPA